MSIDLPAAVAAPGGYQSGDQVIVARSGASVPYTLPYPVVYTLPAATTLARGGVRVDGVTITISGDVISSVGGGSGTISGVTAGTGLSGGGTSGTVTLNIGTVPVANGGTGATTALGARTALGISTVGNTGAYADLTGAPALGTAAAKAASGAGGTLASTTGTFTAGHVAVFADTSGTIQDGGAIGGGGTITSVTAGTGLSGGGSSGAVSLAVNQATTGALGGVTFSATAPVMDGSAAVGTSTAAARSDHVHPTDTSRAGIGNSTPLMDGSATVGTSTAAARDDHRHPTDTTRAPLASPVFTGSITLPTWTTSTRPGSPAQGMEGFATDTTRRETYNGSAWIQYVRTGDIVATAAQLLAGSGTNGVTAAVTVGSGLSLSGGMLTAPGGGSSNLTISNIYTASGAIVLSDTFSVVNSSSQCDMTLANPTTDGQRLRVKRYGSGTVTLTLKLDGAAGSVVTLSSSTVKEAVELVGVVANGTLGTTWVAI